jgi:hypothetical protein
MEVSQTKSYYSNRAIEITEETIKSAHLKAKRAGFLFFTMALLCGGQQKLNSILQTRDLRTDKCGVWGIQIKQLVHDTRTK